MNIDGGSATRHLGYSKAVSFFPAVFILGLPALASAYIDAGTGSHVLQAFIGAFAAGLVDIGMFWKQTEALLGRMFSRFKHHEAPKEQQH